MSSIRQSKPLDWSQSVYRWLLGLYPADFRREYGAEMTQLFRDQCSDAYRKAGVGGLLRLWAASLGDVLHNASDERSGQHLSRAGAVRHYSLTYGIGLALALTIYQIISLLVEPGLSDKLESLTLLLLLIPTTLAGFHAAHRSRRIISGLASGVFSGVVGSVIFGLVIVAGSQILAEPLSHNASEVRSYMAYTQQLRCVAPPDFDLGDNSSLIALADHLKLGRLSFVQFQFWGSLMGGINVLIIAVAIGLLFGAVGGLLGKLWLRSRVQLQ